MVLPSRGNWRLRLMAAVFILFAAAASLYGRGAKEDSVLSHADELIANKEYDQAIRILSDYMQNNPDNFGAAQLRFQKIVRLRERYNEVANELLDTLELDSDNSERILELSNILLAIESPNNISLRRFLDQVRLLAEFNSNRNQLERVIAAARVKLDQNDYSGALTIYASGLDIYQAAYFSSGYGQEAEDLASRGILNINKNIQAFNVLAVPFSKAAQELAALNALVLPQREELLTAYSLFSPMMDELVEIRNSFYKIRESFEDQLVILQEKFDVTGDRSFLSFASRLITGPRDLQEGMTGTMERFLSRWIDPVDASLAGLVDRSYSRGYASMINRDYSGALSTFVNTASYIDVALEHTRSGNSFFEIGDSPTYVIYGEMVSEEKAREYLKFRTMGNTLIYLIEAGNTRNRGIELESMGFPAMASWRAGTIGTAQAISREQNVRLSFQTLINELKALEHRIDTEADTVRSYQESLAEIPGGSGNPQFYLADAGNIVSDFTNYFGIQEFNSTVRQYTIATGDVENRTEARAAEFREGNSFIQGVPRELEGLGVYTARFPSEGLAILSQMTQNLGADIDTARALQARYTDENVSVLERAEINALYVSTGNYLARLLDLRLRGTELIASARTQTERANALRIEGDRLFQAVQAALSRNDYGTARNNLTRASEQYDASLAIQESDSLRAFRDNNLIRLGAEIVRVENEIVVRDVRDFVTNARTRYYNGNMEQAEELLIRAQSRWRVTNVTEHPDVEYWLRLVRGALSLQSGRTIAPTAPLFAEMSQLLSDANRSYNEGVRLLNSGRRQDGLAKFEEAMEKTREVRLMFPMNHDARLLQLRIEQQTDMTAFNAAFRQRLNEAVAGSRARNAESFADLQDLVEINPRYPGIQALLSQAEIDMGLRPPPPNPADLARSTELTRNAEANINSRDTTRYAVAQTQLEEAIRLNPNNTQAQSLMDQLQIRMTGTGTLVLSSFAQNQYNAALQEFLRGNYLSANAIVEQLLQNPESQRSIQIQDLKRRIDALL